MRRDVKRLGIFTTALVCVGFAGAGMLSSQLIQAKAETNVQMVEMSYGAALRLGDNFGMRFQMTVNQEWLDAEAQQGAKVRMLLIREDKLTGELTKDTAGVYGTGETQVLTNRSDVGDEYQYNAVIVDIPDYAYDEAIVARGAIELPTGEYVYTDLETIQVRSVAQVANAALTDKFDEYYVDLGKYLIREIEAEETEYAGIGMTGRINPWLDYFVNATAAIQAKINERTVFTFESSNEDVVTVDAETGVYEAKSGGTAEITVKAWGKEAKCVVTVDENATYQQSYTYNIPQGQYYHLTQPNTPFGITYSNGATKPTGGNALVNISGWEHHWVEGSSVDLGEGLRVNMKGIHDANTGIYNAEWNYSTPIDLKNMTIASSPENTDPLIDFIVLPETALTNASARLSIRLTDTQDENNVVTIRLDNQTYNMVYASFNGTSYWCGGDGVWDSSLQDGLPEAGYRNGFADVKIAFDYQNKALWAWRHSPADYRMSALVRLADLDDPAYFPDAQWKGFTNGTAYLSITAETIETESHDVSLYIRELAGRDFSTAVVKPQVVANYTTNDLKYTIDEAGAWSDTADQGVLVKISEGAVFTTDVLSITDKVLEFKVKPEVIGTADVGAIWIKIQDKNSNNNVMLKIYECAGTQNSWIEYYVNGEYKAKWAWGTSNLFGGYTVNPDGYLQFVCYQINNYANGLWSNNNYRGNYGQLQTNWLQTGGADTAEDVTDDTYITEATISIWGEGYTSDAPLTLFITDLFGADLTSYK